MRSRSAATRTVRPDKHFLLPHSFPHTKLTGRCGTGSCTDATDAWCYGPSPGVKFKDAELIGVPTIAIVGRGVADETNPTIEVKDRRSGDREDIAVADAVAHLVAVCSP